MSARPSGYLERAVDRELDDLLPHLPAISLEGPRGVGKTETARQRAGTFLQLDDLATRELVAAQGARLPTGPIPVVIDEWQRLPEVWDAVRLAVDHDPSPGRFLLTGSAMPRTAPSHSGAGRIVPVRMRPMALVERLDGEPTVSLGELLRGNQPSLEGQSDLTLEGYTAEVLKGGFPGMRHESERAQRAALDGYLDRLLDADLKELGFFPRLPATLRRWLRAYAAATANTISYEKVRDATSVGGLTQPSRSTARTYQDLLARLWILDDLEAWTPSGSLLKRLTGAPKHHLADPALAARVLGLDAGALLAGDGGTPREGSFLGALFESLATQAVRVLAQCNEARVAHLRTRGGEHEVDLVVIRGDQRVVAVEVKLGSSVTDGNVRHLRWLKNELGPELIDAVVITTGTEAYRRQDGIGVVPLALLGP